MNNRNNLSMKPSSFGRGCLGGTSVDHSDTSTSDTHGFSITNLGYSNASSSHSGSGALAGIDSNTGTSNSDGASFADFRCAGIFLDKFKSRSNLATDFREIHLVWGRSNNDVASSNLTLDLSSTNTCSLTSKPNSLTCNSCDR